MKKGRQRRSFRPSTLRSRFSEVGSTVGAFSFAKIHQTGKRPTQSAVCTSSALHSLRPCWTVFLNSLWNDVSFVSGLREGALVPRCYSSVRLRVFNFPRFVLLSNRRCFEPFVGFVALRFLRGIATL